jgi:hypothetical protein
MNDFVGEMNDFAVEIVERYATDAQTKMIGRTWVEWRNDMENGLHPYFIGLMMMHNFSIPDVDHHMYLAWENDYPDPETNTIPQV